MYSVRFRYTTQKGQPKNMTCLFLEIFIYLFHTVTGKEFIETGVKEGLLLYVLKYRAICPNCFLLYVLAAPI